MVLLGIVCVGVDEIKGYMGSGTTRNGEELEFTRGGGVPVLAASTGGAGSSEGGDVLCNGGQRGERMILLGEGVHLGVF